MLREIAFGDGEILLYSLNALTFLVLLMRTIVGLYILSKRELRQRHPYKLYAVESLCYTITLSCYFMEPIQTIKPLN